MSFNGSVDNQSNNWYNVWFIECSTAIQARKITFVHIIPYKYQSISATNKLWIKAEKHITEHWFLQKIFTSIDNIFICHWPWIKTIHQHIMNVLFSSICWRYLDHQIQVFTCCCWCLVTNRPLILLTLLFRFPACVSYRRVFHREMGCHDSCHVICSISFH